MWLCLGGVLVVQALAVYLPWTRTAFGSVPLRRCVGVLSWAGVGGECRVMLAGMTDRLEVAVVRWPGGSRVVGEGLSALLAAYHLRTEAEKGEPVADVGGLPDRYRAEIADPWTAFDGDVVLVAVQGDAAVGCVVVTFLADGQSEIKRLWTDPGFRGRGVASALLCVALAHVAESGVNIVRLSVWEWRTPAIALYERLGFTVAQSWDERDRLVCMQCAV